VYVQQLGKTNLYDMVGIFIPRNLATSDSHVILLPWNKCTSLKSSLGDQREVMDRSKHIQP
jgi:hypothetical protein